MLTDKEIKKRMRPLFEKNYEQFYPIAELKEMGFSRKKCNCGKYFWSYNGEQNYCGEPECVGGYSFIGKPLTSKKLTYSGAWKTFSNSFKKFGYKEIKRYPVTARWYEDLQFVAASINDFQPYVITGEADPPANPLVVPQFCLRFNDIDNVGITGKHYTGFVMMGQHAFNSPEKYVYFKKEGIKQIYEYITKGLGLSKKSLTFTEDMWAGGGNFGPSMEFFSAGLELGNQVYMQYKMKPDDSYEELKTKVIDMGAGLERNAWFTNGTPMSYDVAFPYVLKKLYDLTGIKPDKKIWSDFATYSALLNVDEVDDINKQWNEIAKRIGVDLNELRAAIYPIKALYSIADHTRTLLVATNDGSLPSNVGGGYNLRNILRRCFAFDRQYNLGIDIAEVIEWHKKGEAGKMFPEIKQAENVSDIIKTERDRYLNTTLKGRHEVNRLLHENKTITTDTLLRLYDSKGISPETVREIAEDQKINLDIPANFYYLVDEMHVKRRAKKEENKFDTKNLIPTYKLFYENDKKRAFDATVKKVSGDYVVLNETYFYPTSGGQDHDTGIINNLKVTEVIQQDGVVFHKVPGNNFSQGEKVQGKIDWERREALTKHHTATHVVYTACREILGNHVYQAGAEKKVEKSRLDITHYKPLSFDEIQEIELRANEIVSKQIPVIKEFMNRTEAEQKFGMRIYQGGVAPGKNLRIVQIKGLDAQACGGTHVDNTGEIGLIKIINSERIQDGIVRLEYQAGESALKGMQEKDRVIHELKELWGVPQEKLLETARKFFEEWKQRGRNVEELESEVVQMHIKKAAEAKPDFVGISTRISNPGVVLKAFETNKQNIKGKAVIIFGKDFGVGFSDTKTVDIEVELSKYYKVVKEKDRIFTGFSKK